MIYIITSKKILSKKFRETVIDLKTLVVGFKKRKTMLIISLIKKI